MELQNTAEHVDRFDWKASLRQKVDCRCWERTRQSTERALLVQLGRNYEATDRLPSCTPRRATSCVPNRDGQVERGRRERERERERRERRGKGVETRS